MFFQFIRECFSWLPLPLSVLVNAVITIFLVVVAVQVLKLVLDLIEFLAKVLGGVFAKVDRKSVV